MKKRADGRYCKQVFIGYLPDGKRKFKTIYGKTIKEVEQKERELLNKIDDGIKIENENISVEEWSKIWVNTYKNDVSYNTRHMYDNAINVHIIPALGDMSVAKVKSTHLQLFLNKLVDKGHKRMANICKMTLNQIFKQAVIDDIIIKNPMRSIKPIKDKAKEKEPLTKEQLSSIFKADIEMKQRVFLYLITFMGLRKGEALALTKDDIDQTQNIIKIDKSLFFKDNEPMIKVPKSESGNRILPIPQMIQSELYQYCSLKDREIFTSENGGYMTKSSFRKFWDRLMKLLEEEGCAKFTPHICRHTYCTDLYYAGVKVKTAQYLMGHSNLNMTLGVYTHLDKAATHQDVQILNDYIMQKNII